MFESWFWRSSRSFEVLKIFCPKCSDVFLNFYREALPVGFSGLLRKKSRKGVKIDG